MIERFSIEILKLKVKFLFRNVLKSAISWGFYKVKRFCTSRKAEDEIKHLPKFCCKKNYKNASYIKINFNKKQIKVQRDIQTAQPTPKISHLNSQSMN